MIRFWTIVWFSFASACTWSCDACRVNGGDPRGGGTVGLTAGIGDTAMRWSFDTTFEYRNWDRVNPSWALEINDRPHGHMHGVIDEWFIGERVGYIINRDLSVGLSNSYRNLRQVNVEDPLALGHHEFARGIGDLVLDAKYRIKAQTENFPVDLALFGDVKFPSGETKEHTPDGELFDAENQPGSGSWDGTLGVSASKLWGDWGASSSVSYTTKGEGAQHFKAGDLLRIGMSGSKKLSQEPLGCKIYLSAGLQGLIELKGKDHGEIDRNHGGQSIYAIPGFAVQPVNRLTISVSVPLPFYQELNGTHQKQDWGLQVGVGVRF
jgi:hypothetical protein